MKKILIALSIFFTCIASFAGTVYNYTPPKSSGTIWIVIDPAFIDLKDYRAKITVKWGSYVKSFSFAKAGEGKIVVGLSHWDNQSYNVNVTSNNLSYFGSKYASIYDVYQGSRPSYPYQQLYICGQNLSC